MHVLTTCVFNNTDTLPSPFHPTQWKHQYRLHMTSYDCTAQGQISINIKRSHTATDTISVIVCLMLLSLKAKTKGKKPKDRQIKCITGSSEMVWCFIITWTNGCATLFVVQKQLKDLRLWRSEGTYFHQAVNDQHKQSFILQRQEDKKVQFFFFTSTHSAL